jgi:hypothetical protein
MSRLMLELHLCLSTGSMDADTAAGAFAAFVNIDNIAAQADTADCDIEFVVLAV